MSDPLSPIQHALVLHRREPAEGIARFYALMIERDLFGSVRLVRNWGRIGTRGRELVEEHPTEDDAAVALQAVAAVKRRRGYCDL